MPWEQHVREMIGKPIGISFCNGQGTSGVLCNVRNDVLYVMEYLYQNQFATKHYSFSIIQDVHMFPSCQDRPRSGRRLF